jgi:pimeloyl-ACP methyl ester carboxylesterase
MIIEDALQQLLEQANVVAESRYVQAGQYRTHYLLAGDGAPLVLIHGAGGGGGNWYRVIGPLSKHFQLYAPDVVGFGLSDKPAFANRPLPEIVQVWIVFVRDFMEALGIERASLAGESLGGFLCGAFALAHPGMVNRLVLVDSLGLGQLPLRYRLMAPFLWRFMSPRSKPTRERTWAFLARVFRDSRKLSDDFVEYAYLIGMQPEMQISSFGVMRKLGRSFSISREVLLTDRLGQIKPPTLIVWGEDDTTLPVAHARRAHEWIPGSELRIIPNCGHSPALEQPEEFTRVVVEFLLGPS